MLTPEMLNKAYELGVEYATTQNYYGATEAHESPLSGEWADEPLPADIYEEATGESYPDILTDDVGEDVNELCDEWELGYFNFFASLS